MADEPAPTAPASPPLDATTANYGAHPISPAGNDRYAFGDEIARGGMGAVFLATDTLFNREVAVKVLQGDCPAGSALVRRFADEARIAAQLQHPGIPPVHDTGTLPDGRPFLAMKLIKGDTLAALLDGRRDPSADRGRFVAAFEQVCHAVAYAHARGVIHRDLKPGNVMVGAFGEVQVMDWGLAKLLASPGRESPDSDATGAYPATDISPLRDGPADATRAGAALGTPAYMPPEQAIGALDQIDRRSDVFGLGGILAAILTGRAPFGGTTTEAVRLNAAQGKVDDCFARLDGCGADPELVALCKRCLNPTPADRPADAGAVAEAVTALRLAAEERARQAELDRVRGEEQRARRRVQWGLAVAVLLLLGVTGSTLAVASLWRTAEQAKREAEKSQSEAEQSRADAERERDRVGSFEYGRTVETVHQAWDANEVAEAIQLLDRTATKYRGWEWAFLHRQFNQQAFEWTNCSAVALSRDGTRCATWQGTTVTVRDTTTGASLLTVYRGVAATGGPAHITPDGKRLVTSWYSSLQPGVTGQHNPYPDRDGPGVTVWDVDARKELLQLPAKELGEFVLTGDGTKLVVGMGRRVEVWEVASGKRVAGWECPTSRASSIACNFDATRVVTVEHDQARGYKQSTTLWTVADSPKPVPLDAPDKPVRASAFSADGRTLVTTLDSALQLRDGRTGEVRSVVQPTYAGGPRPAGVCAITPDGQTVAVAVGKVVHVWSVPRGDWAATLVGPAPVTALELTPDGERLVAAYADGGVGRWEVARGIRTHHLKGHSGPCRTVAVSTDGRVVLSQADSVRLWNLDPLRLWNWDDSVVGRPFTESQRDPNPGFEFEWEGGLIFTVHASWAGGFSWGVPLTEKQRPVPGNPGFRDVAVSRDGSRAAIASADGRLAFLARGQKRPVATVTAKLDGPFGLMFSPDGTKVFGVVEPRTGKVWDATTGAELCSVSTQDHMTAKAFSPDGGLLAVAFHTGAWNGGVVRIWNTATGQLLHELEKDTTHVSPEFVCFDAAGARLATANSKFAVKLWDTQTGKLTATMNGHTDAVTSIAFHPRESRLVTGSKDRSVRVWDAASGAETLKLREPNEEGARGYGVRAYFSDDGLQLHTTTDGTTVKTYDTKPISHPPSNR